MSNLFELSSHYCHTSNDDNFPIYQVDKTCFWLYCFNRIISSHLNLVFNRLTVTPSVLFVNFPHNVNNFIFAKRVYELECVYEFETNQRSASKLIICTCFVYLSQTHYNWIAHSLFKSGFNLGDELTRFFVSQFVFRIDVIFAWTSTFLCDFPVFHFLNTVWISVGIVGVRVDVRLGDLSLPVRSEGANLRHGKLPHKRQVSMISVCLLMESIINFYFYTFLLL